MNKKTLRIAGWALGLSMAVAGIESVVGLSAKAPMETRAIETIYSMTPDASTTDSSATSYITSLTEFTHDEISWKMNQWNPSSLQIKTNQSSAASEFRFYNTSAFSGRIKEVVISFNALTVSDASKLMFLGGTSEVTATSGGTAGTWDSDEKTLTWTPGSSDNFTYFAFYQDGKAASGTNKLKSEDAIVVTYETNAAPSESITVTGTSAVYVDDNAISLTATPTGFAPQAYTWTSTETSVATVTGNGATATVTPVAKGTTKITASAEGTNGTVNSADFVFTVKDFGIALSTDSAAIKANKSKSITITPTDANGAVVYEVSSSDSSVATASVEDNVLTITTDKNTFPGATATITVIAKDNSGNSGFHSDTKTVDVEIVGGYAVGNKITSLPQEDTLVYLVANQGGNDKYVTSAITGTTTDEEEASLFYLSSTGTLQQFNPQTGERGSYVYNGGSNATVSAKNDSVAWGSDMNYQNYPGLLRAESGRYLAIDSNGATKAYAINNLGGNNPVNYPIYAYAAVSLSPTATLSGNSVTALKGSSDDTSLKLTLSSFAATGLSIRYRDDGESEWAVSSDIATVTCGHATGDNTVKVAFGEVGQTTVKLIITRSAGDPFEKTFVVTVKEKPGSVAITNELVDGYLEVKNGSNGSNGYTQLAISAKQAAPDQSLDYTGAIKYSVVSGAGIAVTEDGGRVSGSALGTGVVRAYAVDDNSVYADVSVKVIDDYRDGVSSVTYKSNLAASAGDQLDISSVFATKVATTHFGGTEAIDDGELRFSYRSNDYANAVPAASFVYACDENTAVGDTENQRVYVYCTLDDDWSSYFNITVTQTNNAMEGVIFANVTSHAQSVIRNESFQLELMFDPENATNKNVTYSLSNESSGSTIEVSQTGLVTAGSKVGSTARVTVTTEDGGFTDYVDITVALEDMEITVNNPESWGATNVEDLKTGDVVAIVGSNDSEYALSNNNGTSSAPSAVSVTVSNESLSGEVADTIKWVVTKTNNSLKFNVPNTDNYLYCTNANNGVRVGENSNNVFTLDESGYLKNSATERYLGIYNSQDWRCYTGTGGNIADQTFTFYKKSGGNEQVGVDNDLVLAIETFETIYHWDDACAAFAGSDWNNGGSGFTSDLIAKYTLSRVEANKSGNEVEQFLAKYDYIVDKFGTSYDFLARFAEGGINYGAAKTEKMIGTEQGSEFALPLVALSVFVGTMTVGGFFLINRRRREED